MTLSRKKRRNRASRKRSCGETEFRRNAQWCALSAKSFSNGGVSPQTSKNRKGPNSGKLSSPFLFDFCLIKQKSERPSSLSLVCCVRSLFCLGTGNVLFSRAVSSQVHSALRGLTSVFGMGTGGSLLLSSPVWLSMFCTLTTTQHSP